MSDNHGLHDERISRLYKMGADTEPPAHIDAEIKQAAWIAATKKRSYAWPSLATAAVLVLSISLVLKVLNQQPLEEQMMEPAPMDDRIAPSVIMHESKEKALAPAPMRRDKEPPAPQTQPDRFKARQLMKAPASHSIGKKSEGVAEPDAVHDEAVGGVTSFSMRPSGCDETPLPDTDSKYEWIKLYQRAMEQGRLDAARCLRQAYQDRFNQTIPEAPIREMPTQP